MSNFNQQYNLTATAEQYANVGAMLQRTLLPSPPAMSQGNTRVVDSKRRDLPQGNRPIVSGYFDKSTFTIHYCW